MITRSAHKVFRPVLFNQAKSGWQLSPAQKYGYVDRTLLARQQVVRSNGPKVVSLGKGNHAFPQCTLLGRVIPVPAVEALGGSSAQVLACSLCLFLALLVFGCGSKLNNWGYASFSLWFHLPGFHFGYAFLTHSHLFVFVLRVPLLGLV